MRSTRLALGLLAATVCTSALAQNAVVDAMTERIIDTVNLWATVVGVLSALAIGAATFNVIYQITQVRKTGENLATELLSRVEKEIQKMKEMYNLPALKTPEQIAAGIRQDYEPLFNAAKNIAEHARRDSESAIEELRREVATLREQIDSERAHVRGEIVRREETTVKHVQDQVSVMTRYIQDQLAAYRLPTDLEEAILRKVLNAFIQVQALSVDERRGIAEALTAASLQSRPAPPPEQPTLVT